MKWVEPVSLLKLVKLVKPVKQKTSGKRGETSQMGKTSYACKPLKRVDSSFY